MLSKRQSGAKSNARQPKLPIFFLDRSLGKNKIATTLRQRGTQVKIHDDYFPSNAKDREWLPEVGKRGWIVLPKDRCIRYRTSERLAVLNAKV